jgi:hypothetical protein
MVTSFADGTKISFEQAIVANATGMTVARRGMRGLTFDGHVDELTSTYDVGELEQLGGVVDYVVGSRPGPGVYVMATHDDPKQRHYLELYKLGTGPLYSFYTPYHLCHFEVPQTVARAVLFGDATLTPLGPPTVEVVTTAKRDLPAGTRPRRPRRVRHVRTAERADSRRRRTSCRWAWPRVASCGAASARTRCSRTPTSTSLRAGWSTASARSSRR